MPLRRSRGTGAGFTSAQAAAGYQPLVERGLPLPAGGTRMTIPGVVVTTVNNLVAVANQKYYEPFIVHDAITVDALFVEVLAAAGTIARLAIATADTEFQPIATVLEGTVATTGIAIVNTTPAATVLQPGRYVKSFVSDGAPSMRMLVGSLPGGDLRSILGTNPFAQLHTKAAVGTGANNLSAWDTVTWNTSPQSHMVVLRLTAV